MTNLLSNLNTLCPYTAMWGTYLLLPPGRANIASEGIWDGVLSYASELEAEQQETAEAQNPLEVKGGDKQKQFSISVQVNKYATGQNPVDVHQAWMRSLGKSNYFFVGALPISRSRFMLQSVELHFTNLDLAADGSVYRADIYLSFAEDILLRVPCDTVEETEEGGKSAAKVGAKKAAKKAEASSVFDAKELLASTRKSYGV